MISSAKAFAPGNISCIFKIHEDRNPKKMGSLGLGFTLNAGVTVEASLSSKNEVYFNNKSINLPTIENVIKKLSHTQKIKITIASELPLGSGFGLSGASVLATAYALNSLLDLRSTNIGLAKIAHVAEVENQTGLGDVTNQYLGGFLLKLLPSSEFTAEKIPLNDISVYYRYFGKISTREILSSKEMKQSINTSASEALDRIKELLAQDSKAIKFSELITISKNFAQKSGLLTNKRVIAAIKEIEKRGGHASMIMLGNAVFSDIPFAKSCKLEISNTPVHLL